MVQTSKTADPLSLGRFIRDRRRALGLTQTELATRTGFVQERISVMENGKYGMPSLTSLANLATALEVPLSDLIAAAGYSNEAPPAETSGSLPATSAAPDQWRSRAATSVAALHNLRRENDRLAVSLENLHMRLAETEEQMLVADSLRESVVRRREEVRHLTMSLIKASGAAR